MRFWLCLSCLLILAGPAQPGAWPREPGKLFASVSYRMSTDANALGVFGTIVPDAFTSIYAEYGATPRFTFGLDSGFASDGQYGAVIFGRYALSPLASRHKFALVLGAGPAGPPSQAQIQLGGAWGYGFALGDWATGWVGFDPSVIYRLSTQQTVFKGDLTLGLKPSPKWMAILQFQTGQYPASDPYLRAAPSVVYRLTKTTQLEIGADFDLIGTPRVALKLGAWFEF